MWVVKGPKKGATESHAGRDGGSDSLQRPVLTGLMCLFFHGHRPCGVPTR